MAKPTRVTPTTQQAGRPMDWTAFDGHRYHGRIITVRRRRWLDFTYYVPGFGDVRTRLDLRDPDNRARIQIW